MQRIRLSYANVMATIAVFIALGGTSYAALKLPRNSVGATQLRANAVTSAKIRDASIRRGDLARSARVGARGPRGSTGPAGDRGPAGIANAIVRRRDAPALMGHAAGSSVGVATMSLPAGRWLVTASTQGYFFPNVSPGGTTIQCVLLVDGTPAGPGKDLFMGNVTGATHIAELTLSEIVDRGAPSSVVLSCKHLVSVSEGAENPRVQRTRLVALPAETVDVKDVSG